MRRCCVAVLREMSKGYILSGWGDAVKLSADLAGLVTPAGLNPLLRARLDGRARRRAPGNGALLRREHGSDRLGRVWRWRCWPAWSIGGGPELWAVTALAFGVLCLGPLLQINGRYLFDLDGLQASFPLPFIIMHYLPIAKGNRAPEPQQRDPDAGAGGAGGVGVGVADRAPESPWQ